MVLVVISPKTFRMDLQKTRCPLGLNWKSESVTMTDSWAVKEAHAELYGLHENIHPLLLFDHCCSPTGPKLRCDGRGGKQMNTGAEKEVMWLPQEASKPSLKPLTELPGFQCFVSFVFFCVCFVFFKINANYTFLLCVHSEMSLQ